MPLLRHLAPRLLQDLDNFLLVVLLLKRLELVVQKHQAGYIFKDLRLLVCLQILLPYQRSHARRAVLRVPTVLAYLLHQLGLSLLQKRPPCVVAHACHRVRRAGHFPAPKVLCAHCEAQRLGCVWRALVQIRSAFLRIVQLVGHVGAGNGDFGWVERVRGVDCLQGFFEGRRHCDKRLFIRVMEGWKGGLGVWKFATTVFVVCQAYRLLFDLSLGSCEDSGMLPHVEVGWAPVSPVDQ